MLQYPVQLPPLSLSQSPKLSSSTLKDHHPLQHSDYFRPNDHSRLLRNSSNSSNNSSSLNNKRFQKENVVSRSQFPPYNPSYPLSLSISTNLSSSTHTASSPSTNSVKLPRSPYISARQLSTPVSVPPSNSAPIKESRSSLLASPAIEDVLSPGDFVGQGGLLQGETISLVSIGSSPGPTDILDYKEPAKEFEVVRRLGTGSYAVVYLVLEVLYRPPPSEDGHMSMMGSMELDGKFSPRPETVYGREYAIKCLSKANLDEEALANQMSEVTIHQSLHSHPNIVTLHRTLETSSFLLLVLEYVPGEDLFYFLEQARDHYDSDTSHSSDFSVSASRTPPTPSLLSHMHPSQLLSRTRLRLISSMFAQMCEAVAACHAQQVFHRDIKPENFIVTDAWTSLPDGRQERKVVVKLTDFGLSTTDLESSDMDCGSAPYMSYECRNNVAPSYRPRAADVWSLGIVLINMLYHFNPWTDTALGACASFDLFRNDPIKFLMGRFTGMTPPVADLLANRVFCILDDSEDDSKRISASDFGAWAKDLPSLLGGHSTSAMQRTASQGHPISASTPISHRPSSRHPSGNTTSGRTPAVQPRSLSRAPSLIPTYEQEEKRDLSTLFDHDLEEQDEQEDQDVADMEGRTSRSTSTNKRRKRGTRRGRGASASAPALPSDDTLITLAVASQSLAREISMASRSSSHRSPPIPAASPTVPPPPTPVTKKPSKWKLSFGKTSAAALAGGRVSPVDEVSQTPSTETGSSPGMSTTASNVTNLIMGLNAAPTHSTPLQTPASRVDGSTTWGRGRRGRGLPPSQLSQDISSSTSPPAVIEQWIYADRRSERAISPNSVRSGRPVASSASSIVSSNWRNSMSTTSSAGTSTSAFTKYSNSSTRSISTTATSVSSTSWRTNNKSNMAYTNLPKNIKVMNGIPWELDQLPRGQHPNPVGDIFGSPPPRKQRTRKPKELDTISERPPNTPNPKSPLYQRKDVSTSTSDLTSPSKDDSGDGVKKVQKGQINALAKMLSALRR